MVNMFNNILINNGIAKFAAGIGNRYTLPQNIYPAFGVGTRLFDDAVQINNLNQVAAKDRISGAWAKKRSLFDEKTESKIRGIS